MATIRDVLSFVCQCRCVRMVLALLMFASSVCGLAGCAQDAKDTRAADAVESNVSLELLDLEGQQVDPFAGGEARAVVFLCKRSRPLAVNRDFSS